MARILAPFSDGLELNLSCPACAKATAWPWVRILSSCAEITAAVKAAVDVPVVPKLTRRTPRTWRRLPRRLWRAAPTRCARSTPLGPGYFSAHGEPVLSNELGGMSGKGVLPIGLKCVREIAASV